VSEPLLKESANGNFDDLVSCIVDKRWREVFFLTVGMLDNSDQLLMSMKHQINEVIAHDKQIQYFLQWIQRKSTTVKTDCKPTAIRAYYFYFAFDNSDYINLAHNFGLTQSLESSPDFTFDRALDLTIDLALDLSVELACDNIQAYKRALVLDRAFNSALAFDFMNDDTLQKNLQQLQDNLPTQSSTIKQKEWWRSNGQDWIDQLRAAMIEHRNIGHDWQFSEEQRQLLQQYYDANKLLVDCLNSDCYVSREVRTTIEDQLLLPMDSLAKLPPIKP
jgi:predicted NACHT family NTPase